MDVDTVGADARSTSVPGASPHPPGQQPTPHDGIGEQTNPPPPSNAPHEASAAGPPLPASTTDGHPHLPMPPAAPALASSGHLPPISPSVTTGRPSLSAAGTGSEGATLPSHTNASNTPSSSRGTTSALPTPAAARHAPPHEPSSAPASNAATGPQAGPDRGRTAPPPPTRPGSGLPAGTSRQVAPHPPAVPGPTSTSAFEDDERATCLSSPLASFLLRTLAGAFTDDVVRRTIIQMQAQSPARWARDAGNCRPPPGAPVVEWARQIADITRRADGYVPARGRQRESRTATQPPLGPPPPSPAPPARHGQQQQRPAQGGRPDDAHRWHSALPARGSPS